MRFRDRYDWIVLGNHPAALLSASLVAKLGLSVLVLPMTSSMGRFLSKSEQYLDPEPNYLLGLGQAHGFDGLLFQCLKRIGMTPAEESFFKVRSEGPQVLTPTSRWVLEHHSQLSFELNRELGKNQINSMGLMEALRETEKEFLPYWSQFPQKLTLTPDRKRTEIDRLSFRGLRRKLSKAAVGGSPQVKAWLSSRQTASSFSSQLGREDLTELFSGLHFAMTSSPHSNPLLFNLLHLFQLSQTGGSFQGGMTAYREFLIQSATRLGVHIPPKTECRRIFIQQGRFAGVQISSSGSMISGKAAILGCSLGRAYPKATYTGRNWFRRKKSPSKPHGWKFTLAFTLPEAAIPKGLAQRAVWQEKEAPPLELEIANPSDYGKSASDERVIYVRTIMPYTLESLKPGYQRLIAARMFRQVMNLLPFVETHILRIYPDFRLNKNFTPFETGTSSEEENPEARFGFEAPSPELSELYGFPSLDSIPDNLLVFQGRGLGSFTGIEGLLIASEESFPQLGSLGPTLAALEAVTWLARRSGFLGPI